MLFHLPPEYCTTRKLQVEAAIYRLIKRHGRGYWAEEVIDLTIWPNPDGKYLIKGGGQNVWKSFRLRKEHRRLQGIIHGKRCGTTQNIGRAARRRARAADQQQSGGACIELPTEAHYRRALKDFNVAISSEDAGQRLKAEIKAFYDARKDRRIKKGRKQPRASFR